MIKNYFYNKQLKKYIIGFANIFAGLIVRTGKDAEGNEISLEVPIRYGSVDRVVASIGAGNTQNKQHTLPAMACYMTGINLAPERMHGVNQTDSRAVLEQGGIFPDDVKVVRRVMPIPYNLSMELAIYASNTDQAYQILEQILMLFDYNMMLQFNDKPFDWTKITSVQLEAVNNEEVYPTGPDRRVIVWSLQFTVPVWLSPPMDIRKNIIQNISIRIGNIDTLTLDEVQED